MRQKEQEKIKDIIIDYIYDFLYQEKVKIIKSDNLNVSLDSNYNIKDDEELSKYIKSEIKSSEKTKIYFGEREVKYCSLISLDNVHKNFLIRLERLGFKRSKINLGLLNSLIQELCDRGYLVRNQPRTYEIKLSDKGINHYKSGNSFEQKYIEYEEVRKANKLSKIAIWIAGASALLTLLISLRDYIFNWPIL